MNQIDVLYQMLNGERPNYISPGLSSFLLGDEGKQYGRVRAFVNNRPQEFFITPHTHRFDFACLVVRGTVVNTLYKQPDAGGTPYAVSRYNVTNHTTAYVRTEYFAPVSHPYQPGSWYTMDHDEYHTIQFSKEAFVIFFEGKPQTAHSYILEPVVNGRRIPTFSVEDWMYQP